MSDQEDNDTVDKHDLNDPLLRENEEPPANKSPMPVFLLFAFAAVCFWGGIYVIQNGKEFSRDAYSPDYDPHGSAPVVKVSLFDRGAKIYNAQCIACHQSNGKGVAGVYPPLAGSEWVLGHQEVLGRILINGLNGPMEVLGSSYNGNMPAFGPAGLNLKPLDIASVLTYIRQSWGNEGSDFREETLSAYMAEYGSRATPWNAEEIVLDLGPEPEPVIEEAAEGTGEGEADSHGHGDDHH